ncbi:hypothetical protein D3C80_1313460 [compost metagenome]
MVNRMTPKPNCVSRKARAISTGVKVPRVCRPIRLRNTRITSTPIGIMTMIMKVCWVCSGRPYSEYSRKSASVFSSVSLARRMAFISLLLRLKLTLAFLPPSTVIRLSSPVHHSKRSAGRPCSPVSGLKYSQSVPLKLRSHSSGVCGWSLTRRMVWTFSAGTWAMDSSKSMTRALFGVVVSPASRSLTLSSFRLLTRLMVSLTKVSTSAECWRMGAIKASAAIFSGPSTAMLSRKIGPLTLVFSPE